MSDPKNRPPWRARLGPGRRKGENIKPPEPRADGLRTGPRCKATARHTGKPCKNPAMSGSNRCRVHGGHYMAYQSEIARLGADKVISLRSGIYQPRNSLAKLAAEKPTPVGLPYKLSPIERGKQIEAWENRDLDPEGWLKLTRQED